MPRRRAATTTNETPQSLMRKINSTFGEGTMTFASDPNLAIERLPTGILSIDYLLGGGFARGRHAELFGGYSVGKTYTALRFIARSQADGLSCAYVDCEGTYDPVFSELIGVNNAELAYHRQVHGNQVVDFMETLLRSGLYDVIVLDSIAALLPRAELESEMSAATMGTQQAKLMSQALRKLTAANRRTALIYINQTREAVGSVFAARAITSGGRAMGFYAGVRLEFVRVENIKRKAKVIHLSKGDAVESDVIVGHRVMVRVEKDKTGGAKQHDKTTFVFDYEQQGIDHIEDLIYLGRVLGLVHKSINSWWLEGYEDEKQNGRARFKRWLTRNRAVAEELEELIADVGEERNRGLYEEEEEDDE